MSEGLKVKYFVLNPHSQDREHACASIDAMEAYAERISETNPTLAEDILAWIDQARADLLTKPD